MKPVAALRRVEKKVEEVALVMLALVEERVVIVPDAAVRSEMDVVAKVVAPVTPRVPVMVVDASADVPVAVRVPVTNDPVVAFPITAVVK